MSTYTCSETIDDARMAAIGLNHVGLSLAIMFAKKRLKNTRPSSLRGPRHVL